MDYRYEVTVIPVSDVDRAKEFYDERMGFHVDVDHRARDSFRVVQLTPPGSAASISAGTGISGRDARLLSSGSRTPASASGSSTRSSTAPTRAGRR